MFFFKVLLSEVEGLSFHRHTCLEDIANFWPVYQSVQVLSRLQAQPDHIAFALLVHEVYGSRISIVILTESSLRGKKLIGNSHKTEIRVSSQRSQLHSLIDT